MRVYDCSGPQPRLTDKKPSLLTDTDYASVTTKLEVVPNPGIEFWKMNKLLMLARQYLHEPLSALQDRMWGYRETPDGRTLSTSDYGTEVHEELESACFAFMEGADYRSAVWDAYIQPFMGYIETNLIEPYLLEHIIVSHRLKLAGTLDFIGVLPDKRYCLIDHKTRSAKGRPLKKSYNKDRDQLAIESLMLKEAWNLDYYPPCASHIICTDTAKNAVKWWTFADVEAGINEALLANELYEQSVMGRKNYGFALDNYALPNIKE